MNGCLVVAAILFGVCFVGYLILDPSFTMKDRTIVGAVDVQKDNFRARYCSRCGKRLIVSIASAYGLEQYPFCPEPMYDEETGELNKVVKYTCPDYTTSSSVVKIISMGGKGHDNYYKDYNYSLTKETNTDEKLNLRELQTKKNNKPLSNKIREIEDKLGRVSRETKKALTT